MPSALEVKAGVRALEREIAGLVSQVGNLYGLRRQLGLRIRRMEALLKEREKAGG